MIIHHIMAAQNTHITLMTVVAVLVSILSRALGAALCLTGDFDSQLRHILHDQMLSTQDPIIAGALNDLETTLNQRWQGYELILCGSLASGLGIASSDIDLFVKIPNSNVTAGLYVLQETEKLFNKQPELYNAVKYTYDAASNKVFLSFYHRLSKRKFDIEFCEDTGVLNSQLVKYYFALDKRSRSLGVFLKYFFKIHGLGGTGNNFLPSYGLYLLIIFYLQQKGMAPVGYTLQVNLTKSHINDDWELGFNELPYSITNTENLHQLLGGFFKYYSEFNFEEYIVAPFTGRPIPKSAFRDIENFPKEYTLYNNTVKHTLQRKIQNYLNMSAHIIIQDVFMHNLIEGESITQEQATKFKYLLKSVATTFEEQPSESILRAILVQDQNEEPVISCNNATVDKIN